MGKTGATLPIPEMKAMLKRIKREEAPIRQAALRLAAESLNSDAQVDAPVLTGALKEAHIVDHSNPNVPRIGANTSYAAAVHANHPTKSRWYLAAILGRGAVTLRRALAIAIEASAKKMEAEAKQQGASGTAGGDA